MLRNQTRWASACNARTRKGGQEKGDIGHCTYLVRGQPTGGCWLVYVALLERVFAGVVGRGCGHRLPIRRLDLTESKVRELILELQPDFVLFQQLPALVPDVQQYDLIPSNTISHSGTIATIAMPLFLKKCWTHAESEIRRANAQN